MPFLNLADIDQRIDELTAEAEAILDIATEEDRDLSEDEVSRIDEIQGKDGKGGILASLRDDRSRKQAIADRQAAKIANRIDSGVAKFSDHDEKSITVPARAKASRKLKAFDTERDAYIAGNVILAGIYGNQRAAEFCQSNGLSIRNTMKEGDNTSGGFLVPDEMQRSLVRLREEKGVFPRYARNYPMGSDTMTVPRLISDVTAYWPGEAATITASDVGLGGAELVAKKLACLTKVSSELDQDSVVDVAEMVTQSMAYAMATEIDDAGFNGDGTSTYGGCLGLKNALASGAINDAASGNTAATTLDLTDFEATIGTVGQYPGAQPRWFMHSAVFWASAARLQDAAGGNAVNDLGNGPVMQFLGYPVVFTQVMPSTTGVSASTILAYFGDLSLGATLGVRRGVSTAVSTERYFDQDMIGVRCTERIAINVHERGDDVNQRPIVALKTAAS